MKEKIIKLGVFFGILFSYKLLYAQAIRFNQLLVRDELIVQGTLKVNKLEGLRQDTIITKYLRANRITITFIMTDTISSIGLPPIGILRGGWIVKDVFTHEGVTNFQNNIYTYKSVYITAGLFLPVGRKWGTDSVIVGNVKYTGTSFKVTGFTFIDTLGVDTLFIWMNNTWVNIKP